MRILDKDAVKLDLGVLGFDAKQLDMIRKALKTPYGLFFVPPAEAARTQKGDDLPDGRIRQIYGAYVEAKRRCQESTAGITYERLSANLRRTAAEIQGKHPGRQIDFEVIVKDGAAVLRPVVRR